MKLALPDAKYFPTTLSKRTHYNFVASDILLELLQPELDSAFGDVCELAPSISMQRARIDEEGELLFVTHSIEFT